MKSNICIDIGGSYIKYAVFYGQILKKYNLVSTDRANVLNQLKDIIKSISENENDNVNSVGISIPGAVDIEKGIIIHAINLNLYNFDMVNYLKKYFNFNIFIISDRDAGLIGCLKSENFKFTKNVLAVSWGTGIALSIFQNNKLYRSANKIAPEFGHTYISDNENYVCFCGKKGCLNAISGAQAMRNSINKYLKIRGDNIESSLNYIKENKITNILEIGSAIGYSAIMMAKANKNIKVTTIEKDKDRYNIAVSNIKKYNLENQINIINDDATLTDIKEKYDLIFIDAAKGKNILFFEKYKDNLKEDGTIITDNLSFHGLVENPNLIKTKNQKGIVNKIKLFINFLDNNKEFSTIYIPVGDKIAISKRSKKYE